MFGTVCSVIFGKIIGRVPCIVYMHVVKLRHTVSLTGNTRH